MTKQTRRVYPKEFKVNAVELHLKKEKPATEIARDLGIRVELLYRWKREYSDTERTAFSGSGNMSDPVKAELKMLEKRAQDATEYERQRQLLRQRRGGKLL